MNNYFITQKPYSIYHRKESKVIGLVNKALKRLKQVCTPSHWM